MRKCFHTGKVVYIGSLCIPTRHIDELSVLLLKPSLHAYFQALAPIHLYVNRFNYMKEEIKSE